MTPGDVNAFYDPGFNQIGIAAGILQRPVYDASFPMYDTALQLFCIIRPDVRKQRQSKHQPNVNCYVTCTDAQM